MSWTNNKKKKNSSSTLSWPDMWAATSIFFGVGIGRRAKREKPQYYTSNCSNFSSLLLKWCCCCCKLETELIMNKVNRSQDPILPGITFKWLCSGTNMKGNPTYLLLDLGVYPITTQDCGCLWWALRTKLRCSNCRAISRTIKPMSNSKWPLCICPLWKQPLKGCSFSNCVAFLSRFLCIHCPGLLWSLLRAISVAVCVSTRKWDCSASVLFCAN